MSVGKKSTHHRRQTRFNSLWYFYIKIIILCILYSLYHCLFVRYLFSILQQIKKYSIIFNSCVCCDIDEKRDSAFCKNLIAQGFSVLEIFSLYYIQQ